MTMTGDKPGKGSYICNTCGTFIALDKHPDPLPVCPNCNGEKFKYNNLRFKKRYFLSLLIGALIILLIRIYSISQSLHDFASYHYIDIVIFITFTVIGSVGMVKIMKQQRD